MDKKSLADLKARCLVAASNGQAIARAEQYVAELQKQVGVVKIACPNTPQHLLVLIAMAEKGVKAPKPEPKPAPKPMPKPEPALIPVAEETPVEPPKKKGKKGD